VQVQNAKLLMQMGKLDEAKDILVEAVKQDPKNKEAFYYLDKVQQDRERAGRDTQNYDNRRRMVKVNGAWVEPISRESLPTPNPYATRRPLVEPSLQRQAIMDKLHQITLDEFRSEGLPLSEVVRQLADEARRLDPERTGINFLITSSVPAPASATAFTTDPATGAPIANNSSAEPTVDIGQAIIEISRPINDLRLIDVLDAIVLVSDQPIKYTVEDYAVVFSPKSPQQERLFTRTIKVNPNTFYQGLEAVMTNHLNKPVPAPAEPKEAQPAPPAVQPTNGLRSVTVINDMSAINIAIRDYFEAVGVEMKPPKMLYFNDRTGLLMVRATLEDLEIIQQAVEVLNFEPPQITLTVRTVELSPENVDALKSKIPSFLLSSADSSEPNAVRAMSTVNAILTGKQAESIMDELYKLGTVNINMDGGPRVTTLSGRQTQITSGPLLTNVFTSVTNTPNGPVYLTEDIRMGAVYDLIPIVTADGYTINLQVKFHYSEFLGYEDPAAVGKPTGTPLPKFSVGSADVNILVWDGQTVVLGGMTIQKKVEEGGKLETKHILAFVTPEIIDPAGNLVNDPDNMPFAKDAVPPQPAEK